jgi:hypothetical protein
LGFSARERDFLLFTSTASTPTTGLTQRPLQWLPGTISPEVKRPGRESDHSPPSSAVIKDGGGIRQLPIHFYGLVLS